MSENAATVMLLGIALPSTLLLRTRQSSNSSFAATSRTTNGVRLHSGIGYSSPVEYEARAR